MADIRQYPIPADALPPEVGDAYDTLLYELSDWLEEPNPFESDSLLDYFEEHLARCPAPIIRVRYLCGLTTHDRPSRAGRPRPTMPLPGARAAYASSVSLSASFDDYYFSWLAVRLTEAVCELAGSSRLRQARSHLATEWDTIATRPVTYRIGEPNTVRLFKFLFGVLVPFAGDSRTQSIASITQQFRQAATRPAPGPRPPAPPPEPLPQTLQMLCQGGLTPANLRELLAHLGAVDAGTGRWHLGELTGKAAKPKSAFPAAYRALADLGLLKQLEGPTWLKIFVAEFEVNLSPRMANYDTKGQVSKAFHEFYDETLRWAKVWQAKHEADQ